MKVQFTKPSLLTLFENLTKFTGNDPHIRQIIIDNITNAMRKRKKQLEKRNEPVTTEAMMVEVTKEQEFMKLCKDRFNINRQEWEGIATAVAKEV